MKIRDSSNHGCRSDKMLAVEEKLLHQRDVFCIPFDQLVAGVGIVGLLQPPVLAEVVKTDHFVPAIQ